MEVTNQYFGIEQDEQAVKIRILNLIVGACLS